jgi:hypothetical protein
LNRLGRQAVRLAVKVTNIDDAPIIGNLTSGYR